MRNPHPANYGRPLKQIEHAAELLARAANVLPQVWPRICDGISGQPSAQRTDGDGAASSVLDDHGVPMPRLSDPTGEANTRSDPSRRDIDELRRLAKRFHADAERFTAILASHQARSANGYERTHTAENDPGCRSCARLEVHGAPRWEPVHRGVKLGDETVQLCSWCERWAREHGAVPPRQVLVDHHDGKRIRRSA